MRIHKLNYITSALFILSGFVRIYGGNYTAAFSCFCAAILAVLLGRTQKKLYERLNEQAPH